MSVPQIPDVGFSDNTHQRTPCVLVLDCSGSMAGQAIAQLNHGLVTLEQQLKANPMTALRVQLLVITVGGYEQVEIAHDWCDAIDFTAPVLEANGTTPLGTAMSLAMQKIEEQKQAYDANGISSTRPWIMLISDGAPNDHDWEIMAQQCRNAETRKKMLIYPIGTEGADFSALALFSNQKPKKLVGLHFNELFVWLSRSMTAVSSATPGQVIQLPAADWSQVET